MTMNHRFHLIVSQAIILLLILFHSYSKQGKSTRRMVSHIYKCVFIVMINIAIVTAPDDGSEFIFGECQPGKESCRDCYLTLVKSLLGNDGNVFNLSRIFTTGDFDEPSFVKVNYWFQFDGINKNESSTWFWAKTQTYLFHPLEIFQFISLFFGNPRELYETTINLSLNGTECDGVNDNHMRLLTQRVRMIN